MKTLISSVSGFGVADIGHQETNYDELLGSGWDRSDARRAVAERIDEVLSRWEAGA
jgi:hypothetical protein